MQIKLFSILATFALLGAANAQTGSQNPQQPPTSQRSSFTVSVQDITDIEGKGESKLVSMGLVVGLNGTGDPGSELAVARPLAKFYASKGNPLQDLESLAKAQSAAVVMVECTIPAQGARENDRFDVTVSVLHSASSLKGGRLLIAPLTSYMPNSTDPTVWALASGAITLDDPQHPTVGTVPNGAQMIRDLKMAALGNRFTLKVRPHYRSWNTTQFLANEINGMVAGLSDFENEDYEPIARALNDIEIEITIPDYERSNPAAFISTILTTRLDPTLLDLPAMVIANERRGTIVVTEDVEISTVMLTHKDLTITTTNPPPVPTPADPIVNQDSWIDFGSASRPSARARISDLLNAFDQLDIPTEDQIDILDQINKTGRLHARFVREN